MVWIMFWGATTCSKLAIETPEQQSMKYALIRVFSDPYFPVYGQNHIPIFLYFIYKKIWIRESLYFGILHLAQDVKYIQS